MSIQVNSNHDNQWYGGATVGWLDFYIKMNWKSSFIIFSLKLKQPKVLDVMYLIAIIGYDHLRTISFIGTDVSARGVADVGGIKVERLVIRHQTFTQVSDVRYSLYWLTDFVYQY